MMYIGVQYEDACKNYPTQLNELVTKLRRGRSRHKNDAPQCMRLYFSFSIAVTASSPTNTRVDNLIARTSQALLRGEIGRWQANSNTLITIPRKILEEFYSKFA